MYTARYKPSPYYPGGMWEVFRDGNYCDSVREWCDVVRRYPGVTQA